MIRIGGLQKVTLIDYPGKVAASVFLAGCNFRCPFCHNPDIIVINKQKKYISQKDFFAYLNKRKNLLEGVCVGGGEPLLNKELGLFLKKIKKLGLLVKLDTNGYNTAFLQNLIEKKLIDYIAMDIKASSDKYDEITKTRIDINKIKQSIQLIMNSGLDYEFRTTLLPKLHSLEEVEKIAKMIKGANKYFLQKFNNKITLDQDFKQENTFTDAELEKFKKIALKYINKCQIRG